jgi:hypothetical protein
MKTISILLLVLWSLGGTAYWFIETYRSLEEEALMNPDNPTPPLKIIAFGPVVGAAHAMIYIILRILQIFMR